MIDTQQRAYLIEVLIHEIAADNSLRSTLCGAVPHVEFAVSLTTSEQPATLITNAVQLCIEDGWKHAPPWLGELVRSASLVFRMQSDARLQAIRDFVAVAPPAPNPANLLAATVLNKGTPFVNRTKLRACLKFLETPAAQQQPILVVNGGDKVGKSYTSRYVEHFTFTQDSSPRIMSHRIEFKPDQALSLGPEQLAMDLVWSLARPFTNKPPPETNQKLFTRQLASWVLSEAVQTGFRHWFILDGFRANPALPETQRPRLDTMDFLIELTTLVTGGSYVERCRLILPGFDRALLTVDPGKVEEEKVKPSTHAEALLCLEEALRRAPTPVPLQQFEPLLLGGLPAGAGRMPELNLRLRALLEAMTVLPEILESAPGAEYAEVLLAIMKDLPAGPSRLAELALRLDALRATAMEGQPP